MDMSLSKPQELVMDTEAWRADTILFFIHTREITRGPLMNVTDRHGYGSEMRQKAIMVEQKKEMHLFVRIS